MSRLAFAFFGLALAHSQAAVGMEFSLQEIRKGITAEEALASAQRQGWIVRTGAMEGGANVLDPRTQLNVGALWFCNGKLYGYSRRGDPGVSSFADNVVRFTREFGAGGLARGDQKVLPFGKENNVVIEWRDSWRHVTLKYTPPDQQLAEFHSVTYAVPGVCSGRK